MTLYAWRTLLAPTPERAAAGCPRTGWVHEGEPPWRVIVFPDLESAQKGAGDGREPALYTGAEDTVTWDELLPPPARSTARADAERLHYRDVVGRLHCPEEYPEPAASGLTAVRCPHLFDVIRYCVATDGEAA